LAASLIALVSAALLASCKAESGPAKQPSIESFDQPASRGKYPKTRLGSIGLSPTFPGQWGGWSRKQKAQAFELLADSGVDIAHIGVEWGHIETDAGEYDWADTDFQVRSIIDGGMKLSIILNAVDAKLPEDIKEARFSDRQFRERHQEFMKLFLNRYQGMISYLWLGNEVNLHLSVEQNEQKHYIDFFQHMSRIAKETHPDLQVGLIVTFPYEEEPIVYDIIEGAKTGDLIGYTYYPQWLSMKPENADSALDRIDALNRRLGTRYAIVETAWSSQRFGGSKEAQAKYVKAYLASLSNNPQSSREFVCYWGLYDPKLGFWHKAAFMFNRDLIAWLESLGMITSDGKPKPAWNEFVEEIKQLQR
jgi:sugar phosphate isomerase/epimerase